MAKTVRLGFVGAGAIVTNRRLKNLAEIDDIDIVAICDKKQDLAESVAASVDARPFVDYRHMFDETEMDAVYVCLPPFAHDDAEIIAAQRGIHLFVEKPDLERAKQFVKEGNYLWNSGMFFWRVDTLIEAIDRYLPRLYRDLLIIDKEIGTPHEFETTRAIFAELEPVAIDRGVMERADSVLTVPGDFGWNDVGSFATLYDYWEPDEHGNRIRGRVVAHKSTGLLVDSPRKLVAAVGVDDLIIVDTSSAILICSKRAAQDVGKIVDMLQERGEIEHL